MEKHRILCTDKQEHAVLFFQDDSTTMTVYLDAYGRNKMRTDRNGKERG